MQRKLPAVSSFAGLPAFGNDSDDSDGEEGPPSTASSLMAAEARDKDPLNLPKGRAQVTALSLFAPQPFNLSCILAKGRAQVILLSSVPRIPIISTWSRAERR